jgi:hypothetical protein
MSKQGIAGNRQQVILSGAHNLEVVKTEERLSLYTTGDFLQSDTKRDGRSNYNH